MMDEPTEFDPHLQELILEVVDNQLRDGEPPETKQTYDRLIKQGISPEEARRLIGVIVISEIYDISKTEKPFDHARFVKALDRLPQMPWED